MPLAQNFTLIDLRAAALASAPVFAVRIRARLCAWLVHQRPFVSPEAAEHQIADRRGHVRIGIPSFVVLGWNAVGLGDLGL